MCLFLWLSHYWRILKFLLSSFKQFVRKMSIFGSQLSRPCLASLLSSMVFVIMFYTVWNIFAELLRSDLMSSGLLVMSLTFFLYFHSFSFLFCTVSALFVVMHSLLLMKLWYADNFLDIVPSLYGCWFSFQVCVLKSPFCFVCFY